MAIEEIKKLHIFVFRRKKNDLNGERESSWGQIIIGHINMKKNKLILIENKWNYKYIHSLIQSIWWVINNNSIIILNKKKWK